MAVEETTDEFKEQPPEYFLSSYKLTLEKEQYKRKPVWSLCPCKKLSFFNSQTLKRFSFPEDNAAVLIYISRGHALSLLAKGKEHTNFHLEAYNHIFQLGNHKLPYVIYGKS